LSATVTGNLKTLGTAVPGGNPTVRFWLYNTGGNIPRVIGTGVIVPNYVDFVADASGAISGSIYKNSEIDVGGATNTYYHVEFINLTGVVPAADYSITAATFDISTATPITTTATVTPPTGDNTYARLDGGNQPFTAGIRATKYGSIRFAGEFASNQAAVTNAGTTGAVIKEAGEANADAFQTPSPLIPIIDLTHGNFGVLSVVEAVYPVKDTSGVSLPLGNDVVFQSRGAADVHIKNIASDTTSTTSVAPGSRTITVGSTASLYTGASITIEPGGASEETITSGNWSIGSSTSITATFANSHTQPYTVRQVGYLFYDGPAIKITGDGKHNYVTLVDGQNNTVAQIPINTGGSFPDTGWKWNAVQTGMNGANKDIIFRLNTSSSGFKIENSANTANIVNLTEASGSALLLLGNATNSSIKIQADSDAGRLWGGGTNNALLVYGNQGATGTNGTFSFRNNNTDGTETLGADSSTQTVTAAKLKVASGGTTVTQIKIYSQSLTPASVSAASAATQTFTVTGLTTADKLIVNTGFTPGNSAVPVGYRVSSADTLEVTYINPTAGSLTPTSGTYNIVAIRS
jgi:hypothetical protein